MDNKKLPVCFLFHGNLQYAEIPSSETKNIVLKSYLPTLELFIKHPKAKAVMDFSGVSLEILAQDYPEVIEKLRHLIEAGNVELCFSTYANPILPLIPIDHAREQIKAYQKIHQKLFGDIKVTSSGFFPHEYFLDATIVELLKEFSFDWIPVWGAHLANSLKGNLNNYLIKPLTNEEVQLLKELHGELVKPIRMLGTNDSQISGLVINHHYVGLMHDLHGSKLTEGEYFSQFKNLKLSDGTYTDMFVFLGPSDMEFIGYYSYQGNPVISIGWFEDFIKRIESNDDMMMKTASQHLRSTDPVPSIYLKCGGDHPATDIWTKDDDNLRLNALCEDAANWLRLAGIQLSMLKQQGKTTDQINEIITEAKKAMMLAENGDGRGWKPIPERRLYCYNQALLAINKAQQALTLAIKLRE